MNPPLTRTELARLAGATAATICGDFRRRHTSAFAKSEIRHHIALLRKLRILAREVAA